MKKTVLAVSIALTLGLSACSFEMPSGASQSATTEAQTEQSTQPAATPQTEQNTNADENKTETGEQTGSAFPGPVAKDEGDTLQLEENEHFNDDEYQAPTGSAVSTQVSS